MTSVRVLDRMVLFSAASPAPRGWGTAQARVLRVRALGTVAATPPSRIAERRDSSRARAWSRRRHSGEDERDRFRRKGASLWSAGRGSSHAANPAPGQRLEGEPHSAYCRVFPPNELRIGLDGPETVSLHLTGTAPGPPTRFRPLTLAAALTADDLPAYSRVLLDFLRGDCTLSIRGDEAELSWQIVTPILDAWRENRVPMQEYPAGSDGPPTSPV